MIEIILNIFSKTSTVCDRLQLLELWATYSVTLHDTGYIPYAHVYLGSYTITE